MPRLRLTLLNQEFGALYPSIPVDQWLPAWEAARRRADEVWFVLGQHAFVKRLLPEEHFRFQGGKPRSGDWYPERSSDVTAANKTGEDL
jgi:hypothetical protein